ncbi:glutaminase A [Naumannella sp. ID2617S]|nr:glutaminase A [Naumannella sp. ID2617S]
MNSPDRDLQGYLDQLIDDLRDQDDGEPNPLPVHANADLSRFAIAVVDTDGNVTASGDAEFAFPIQSMSKAFVYALAIECLGLAEVNRYIDVEPSGEAFNRIALDPGFNRPANAMINAGAITAHSLVTGPDAEHRVDRILALLSRMAGRDLAVNEDCFSQEMEDAHRNLAIAHMLKAVSELPDEPHGVVTGYTRQCAIEASTIEYARMGATLANRGVVPGTDDRCLSEEHDRHVLGVMLTCGMYDSAGDWVSTVGIPAKSGIGGGIIGVVPGRCGIAVHSPRLDQHGNSVRGILAFERMSEDLGLHVLR